MGSLDGENIHAKVERVMVDLVKGKEMAIQLQTLLDKPVKDHGPVSAEDLALQIFRSFTDSLSVLDTCDESTGPAQIAAVDGGVSASSQESKKKPAVKNRRGCYKRRTSDSRVTVSPLLGDDGYAWRKYGQKDILNSEFPRCYFRCTHKYQGCKATKQVQRIKKDPNLYQITYFNRHTCTETPIRALPPLDYQPNLLSFQSRKDGQPTSPVIMTPPLKEEPKEDAGSEDGSDAKSSLDDAWRDFVGSECFGYDDTWAPTLSINHEDGASWSWSARLHGLDMDDSNDQLADIGTFHFDEMY